MREKINAYMHYIAEPSSNEIFLMRKFPDLQYVMLMSKRYQALHCWGHAKDLWERGHHKVHLWNI